MYYARIETSAAAKREHNRNMAFHAASRRQQMTHKRRAECAPNRKAKAKLAARIKDYETMLSGKGDFSGYHKPGSWH